MASEHKTNEDHKLLFDKMIELNAAVQRVKMFVSFEDGQKLSQLAQVLAAVIKMHIGDSQPPMPDDAPICKEVLVASAQVNIVVRKRIKELGAL
jgi:hypothetical protein